MSLKRTLLIIIYVSIVMSCSCQQTNKIDLDEFIFYMPTDFELIVEPNDENVLLALDKKFGNTIIIQKKLNILKTTFFKNEGTEETLMLMHQLKFDSYIKSSNGYKVGETTLNTLGNISFTKQVFLYNPDDFEVAYDVRIIYLKSNYYAIYSFGISNEEEVHSKVIDDMILSLSSENYD